MLDSPLLWPESWTVAAEVVTEGLESASVIHVPWTCPPMSRNIVARKLHLAFMTRDSKVGETTWRKGLGDLLECLFSLLYLDTLLVPSPPQNLMLVQRGENTMQISWMKPLATNGPLTGYTIRANKLFSYSQVMMLRKIIPMLNLSWTVAFRTDSSDPSSQNMEGDRCGPGIVINGTRAGDRVQYVRGCSQFGRGKSSGHAPHVVQNRRYPSLTASHWIELIQFFFINWNLPCLVPVPDPPPPPSVMAQDGQTMTVKICSSRNTKGPLSKYRLVMIDESRLFQTRFFSMDRVVRWNESKSYGYPKYIAAEFRPDVMPPQSRSNSTFLLLDLNVHLCSRNFLATENL